jgi:hypothetical protein
MNNSDEAPSESWAGVTNERDWEMKVRILIAVATVAVALHVFIFVALGRLAKDRGPTLPTSAAAPVAATPPAVRAPDSSPPKGVPPVASTMAVSQSRHVAKLRRRTVRETVPRPNSASEPPVFDLKADETSPADTP